MLATTLLLLFSLKGACRQLPVERCLPVTPRDAQRACLCGGEGIRTPGLLRAREALCQLSYTPQSPPRDQSPRPASRRGPTLDPLRTVGLCGLEPQTSVLSGPRSNHLS
jgi:hypothetical protein